MSNQQQQSARGHQYRARASGYQQQYLAHPHGEPAWQPPPQQPQQQRSARRPRSPDEAARPAPPPKRRERPPPPMEELPPSPETPPPPPEEPPHPIPHRDDAPPPNQPGRPPQPTTRRRLTSAVASLSAEVKALTADQNDLLDAVLAMCKFVAGMASQQAALGRTWENEAQVLQQVFSAPVLQEDKSKLVLP